MYVCLCNAVTESDIKQAVDSGANCLKHIASELNVGTKCGSCTCDAKRCISEALEAQIGKLDLLTY